MISALFCTKNEPFLKEAIRQVYDYVEEVIVVNNGDPIELEGDKIKIFTYPETNDMGALRQFSLDQATQAWVWQIDSDEWYPKESCEAIRSFIFNPGEAISARVPYYQLSWREGYQQANFKHYPDRIYRRDVVDRYDGLLPNDMTKVKKEFYKHRPFLEYDNINDQSFENPKQPIIQAPYYHLARTRGYNFEYQKWKRYNEIIHPDYPKEKIDQMTRTNQWVSGLYSLDKIEIPFELPETEKKVSIIIPNFQYKDFVGKAIESCQNQTVKPYEIIVVDDGSHDNSREVIDKYDVIKLYQHNQGVACARNAGANLATGDILLFLDADDELAPNYLEETLKEFKGDIQVVYTDLEFIGDQSGTVQYPDYSLDEMRKSQCVPSTCALVDRRVFELVGGFDNGEWYEDYGWWLRIATKGFNFKRVPKPLFRYRKHGSSRINMLDQKQVEGFRQLKERYGKY